MTVLNEKSCPRCGGKGYILAGDNIPGPHPPEPEKVECSECHGSGLLEDKPEAGSNWDTTESCLRT
jgi:DnaJ-class molecular chaperone